MVAALVPNPFGDIVTAISIVHSIYTALSDSTGSSSEYTCLIEELRSFEVSLRLIDEVLQTTPVSKNLRQAIEAETTRCLNLLRKFWGRIEHYEAILSGRWIVIWRKVTWAIWKAPEVQRFRRKLSCHKQNIAMFLELQKQVSSNNFRHHVDFCSATASFHANQQRPLTGVGYDLENALILIDALGERVTLPMQFCFSPDVRLLHTTFDRSLTRNVQELHETLIRLFKGKIGESLVEQREYSISTKDGNSIVASNNWGDIVKKGTVVVMSVIVKKVALRQEHASRQRNVCPRCYETPVGVMPDDGWLQWYVTIILLSIH